MAQGVVVTATPLNAVRITIKPSTVIMTATPLNHVVVKITEL